MKRPFPFTLFALFALFVAACVPVTPPATTEPPPATAPPAASLGSPSTPSDLEGLPPGTILIQRDYEPGFTRMEVHYAFGRVPPFTLYADGTVIYLAEGAQEADQQIMVVKLNPEETLELLRQVLDAGFERLESYTDFCMTDVDGEQMCVADAGTSILRVRMPDGELREVKNYFEFANEPAVLAEIRDLLDGYSHPEAQTYQPAGATLFLQPFDHAEGVTLQKWPLDESLLAELGAAGELTAVPLQGEDLTAYLAGVSHNIGDAAFELDGRTFSAYLVPWLPGVDFTEDIREEFSPRADIPSPTSSRFEGCPETERVALGTLRLAWIQGGDLWIWDRGAGEPYSLTASGDLTALNLTADGGTVLYVRQTGAGGELWASGVDGQDPRLLAGGQDLPGQIEVGPLSWDEQQVAFTHLLPERGGELWVADLGGSGARRLVSYDDLMAIVNEPLADFATPTGVTWLPNTYTLTYDAFPGFDEDGIYIYVQRQVYVVDAMSGAQAATLPLGEGGQVAYSPDGTTMTIATPEDLWLMNIEARDLHEAGFDFFATGFGEFYAYPPMAWTSDSTALLIAQPATEGYDQDIPVSIWSVPSDGSVPDRLAEFSGFFFSFAFSPDRTRVAYWRAVAPQSNTRELHIAALDGSQHVVYDTADQLGFLGWGPDSQSFVYVTGEWPGQVMVANACKDPAPMELGFYPGNLTWLDEARFFFERHDEGVFELYLGNVENPGQPELVLNLEQFNGYDYVVLPQ